LQLQFKETKQIPQPAALHHKKNLRFDATALAVVHTQTQAAQTEAANVEVVPRTMASQPAYQAA
jgi:hypothetical protein